MGFELIATLRRFKPLLEYAARTWKLPALIRVVATDQAILKPDMHNMLAYNVAGTSMYFQIQMDVESFHELKNQCYESDEFANDLLFVFLHECAHFIRDDEQEADSEVRKIINEFNGRRKNIKGRCA